MAWKQAVFMVCIKQQILARFLPTFLAWSFSLYPAGIPGQNLAKISSLHPAVISVRYSAKNSGL
jgi:hypothetical protein